MFTVTIAFLSIALTCLWIWLKYNYSYWQRKNVPFLKPDYIFGNFKEILTWKSDPCTHFTKLYKSTNEAVLGIYVLNKPALLIRDLDLIKNILIKDFNKFSNRHTAADSHSDSIGADNLFFVKNPNWKLLRTKLTPVFTSGKIKQMFPLIEEIGKEFDRYLCSITDKTATKTSIVEVKDINALYTTDVIAISAYGVKANSLSQPNSEFRQNGKRIFTFTRRRAIEFNMMFFCPKLTRLLKSKVFSEETTQFLRKTLYYVMDEREKSGVIRNDLIDILIKFREEAKCQDGGNHFILENDSLVAQAAIFFSAGFETSSATMSFGLYELAKNPEVQNRLRSEIKDTLLADNGKLIYENVTEMKYLHNVIQEVLRFYPPLPFLDRECTLSNNKETYSLKPFVDFDMPNGMPIFIPMQSLHMDPKHFKDPKKFNPDRFLPENREENNMSAYMPFGHGPHNCIGERFGLLQTKIGLINFLRNHCVMPCEKTPKKMKLDPRALIIQSEGGIYCKLIRDPLV